MDFLRFQVVWRSETKGTVHSRSILLHFDLKSNALQTYLEQDSQEKAVIMEATSPISSL